MNCFRDLIDAFGIEKMQEITGLSAAHVRVMKSRNSVPTKYWGAIMDNSVSVLGSEITFRALDDMRARAFTPGGADRDQETVEASSRLGATPAGVSDAPADFSSEQVSSSR
jgi:hypothetical protein